MGLSALENLASSPGGALFGHTLGILGLLLGIIGFAITIRQVRAVKTATEAAEEAITGLKIRFSHFDVIQETAIAESSLVILRKLATGNDLTDSAEAHDKLAISLVNLRERFVVTDTEISNQISGALTVVESLPKLIRSEDSYRNSLICLKYLNGLRLAHAVLVKIRFRIQQEQ